MSARPSAWRTISASLRGVSENRLPTSLSVVLISSPASSRVASEATRELAGELIKTTLGEVGKRFSETQRSEVEIKRHADGLADMFCAYLDELARRKSHS